MVVREYTALVEYLTLVGLCCFVPEGWGLIGKGKGKGCATPRSCAAPALPHLRMGEREGNKEEGFRGACCRVASSVPSSFIRA